jgi:XTP/dITP diphosphohydrolase
MTRLVLASSNHGKLAEIEPLLEGSGYTLVAQGELGVSDAIEDGKTFVENALIKARHACAATGLAALADDSGLVVDALGGAPGLLSARYSGAHGDAQANNRKLLEALRDVPEAQRTARFVAVIVLLRHTDDPLPLIAQGVWEGRVLATPRGANGFGYDPVFFDPSLGRGAGELEPELKNRISHRGRALQQLRQLLAC